MNIQAMRNDGISFMTHKLTEQAPGNVFYHEHVVPFWDRARAAGVPYIGCYVVPRSGISVATQVATALRYMDHDWLSWPGFFWQVDTERWPYDSVALSTGEAMAAQLEAATGKQAVHYASVGQYGSAWSQPYPRWNANYPYTSRLHYLGAYTRAGGDSGRGWVGSASIWQYCSNTIVGPQVQVDANAYKGTLADFGRMIGIVDQPPPPVIQVNTNSVWMG